MHTERKKDLKYKDEKSYPEAFFNLIKLTENGDYSHDVRLTLSAFYFWNNVMMLLICALGIIASNYIMFCLLSFLVLKHSFPPPPSLPLSLSFSINACLSPFSNNELSFWNESINTNCVWLIEITHLCNLWYRLEKRVFVSLRRAINGVPVFSLISSSLN